MPNPFLFPGQDAAQPSAGSLRNPFLVMTGPVNPETGYAEDITKSTGAGLARGTGQLIGAPADLSDVGGRGMRWLITKALEKVGAIDPEAGEVLRNPLPGQDYYKTRLQGMPQSGDLLQGVKSATGLNPHYKAQTLPGEYAGTLAEFAPGAVFGWGTIPQRVAQIAIPALVSETAGQTARNLVPEAEGALRIGGALLGAGGVGAAQLNRTPQATIGNAIQGADPAATQRATALIQDAASQGVRLTWDEAIQHATGGATRLSDLRRVVENSRGGGSVLKPLMAERPGQVQAAADTAFGSLAPTQMDPVRTGIAAQQAADKAISTTQSAINTATRPLYRAVENQTISPFRQHQLELDPLYNSTIRDLRGDPAINRGVDHLPDYSVGVLDLLQRRIREMAENARAPGQAHTSNLAAANLGNLRSTVIDAAENATGGPAGLYGKAREIQSKLRRSVLEPLTEGPVGQIAATKDVLQQGRAILPTAPPPGSAPIAADTITQIAMRHPEAAANVLHHHLRAAFDEATQNLASGPNQFGGAKFASVIAGNGQQAQNLEAAVRALPNGGERWEGFRRFLDVMEATGQRPQPGSMTAFNAAEQAQMTGGLVKDIVTAPLSFGTSVVSRLKQFGDQIMMGRNTEQIAKILSDPASGALLERLATAPPGSEVAASLAARLSLMGGSASRGGQSVSQPRE